MATGDRVIAVAGGREHAAGGRLAGVRRWARLRLGQATGQGMAEGSGEGGPAAAAGTSGGQPRRWMPPQDAISADELEAIHLASLRVLEEIGIDILDAEARAILGAAGAEVAAATPRVRLDRGLVLEAVGHAPAAFTIHARNPARHVRFGADWLAFAVMGSAPNCADLERGRRPGTRADFQDLVRLGQAFDVLHLSGGYPVEPIDLHPRIRHLDATADFIRLTDKVFPVYSLGAERNRDGIEMVRIARGIDRATLEREPSLMTVINSSSPLRLDAPMAAGIVEMARAGQVVVMTPFTLAGAMAPVTLAGALAQQNAEALAGIALAQLVRPGAPVMYGGFTSNVDMRSGAPAFGTPEYMKAVLVGGQLARRYAIPYRSSNTNAANAVDAQAAYESVFSLWAVVMGGASFVKHAAGWMEGGLTCSFEKLVLDVELLELLASLLSNGEMPAPSRSRLAAATDGADLCRRAHRIWKAALAAYAPPPLDPAIAEELDAFIAHRKEQGGVRTDF